MPKIIDLQGLAEDSWKVIEVAANEAPEDVRLPVGPLLVPLAVWQARREDLIRRNWEHGEPLGVWLAPGDDPQAIAADLEDLSLIAVQFPKFSDGRGYSTARLLRERLGYRNELRAFGDVGRDQLFFLGRVGFDTFALAVEDDANEDLLASLAAFPEVYQGAVRQPQPLFRRRIA